MFVHRRIATGLAPVLALAALVCAGCSSSTSLRDARSERCCPQGSGLLGASVNTAADEYGAYLEQRADGARLWFTSSRGVDGKKQTSLPSDIFVSKHAGALSPPDVCRNWGNAERMPQIGSAFDTWTKGAVTMFGNEVVLAAEQPVDGSNTLRPGASGYNLFLWKLQRGADGTPRDATPVENVNLASAWTSQPALSPGGDTLLFASDRPNPLNPADTSINIWYAVRTRGVWGAPSIVASLATPVDDMCPGIDSFGALYFSTQWDFASGARSRRGFDVYLAGALQDVLAGRAAKPVDINTVTAQEGFSVNTAADEIFPQVSTTETGQIIVWSSNREDGFGGFDIYACRLPVPRIWLSPVVTCYEKGNVKVEGMRLEGRVMGDQRVKAVVNGAVTDMRAGEKIQVKVGDRVSFLRAGAADECITMSCPIVETVAKFGDTLQLVNIDCDCNPKPVESILISDASGIPYFVTGYWWPNTSRNLAQLNRQAGAGTLARAKFIDRGDYDYTCASKTIDDFFARNIYDKIDNALRKVDNCSEKDISLMITVVGYTDACNLVQGSYTDETVLMPTMKIASGTDMWSSSLPSADGTRNIPLKDRGQYGNVILSKLRSYFTMKTIDRDMGDRSETYKRFRDAGRIVFDYDGMGVYEPTAWRGDVQTQAPAMENPCRKRSTNAYGCNNPEGRRIEIFITPVVGDPRTMPRPLETDFVQKEQIDPEAQPRPCGCVRAEHVFRDSSEAVFTKAMLLQFTDPAKIVRDSVVVVEETDDKGARQFRLHTGCLPAPADAQEAARIMHEAVHKAITMLEKYTPGSKSACRQFSLSFGTFLYPRNAQILRDTLRTLLGAPVWIDETTALDTHEKRYSVRSGMYADRAEAQQMMESYAAVLRKARISLEMMILRETLGAVE